MMRDAFLTLDDAAVADHVRASNAEPWALALGGTRRAFLASGGNLGCRDDLERYFAWSERTQRDVLDQLFRFGIDTVIAVARIPSDRGGPYAALVRQNLRMLIDSTERGAFYADRNLRVSFAGDLAALAASINDPLFAADARALAETTAAAPGPRLIYLFRGSWIDPATEEAGWGYRLGQELGRMPTRTQLITAFYGVELAPLSVFVGSGRSQITTLRPPFLGGEEALYWAHTSPIRLGRDDWLRLLHDYLFARRTQSNRTYQLNPDARAALVATLTARDGHILGVGHQHPLGFWLPDTNPARHSEVLS